jgi:zinc transport system substrate-binding protein
MIQRPCLILFCILLVACKPQASDIPSESIPPAATRHDAVIVIASNYPLYFFAQQIAGDAGGIDIRLPAMTGDPAEWKPDSAAIAELQNADLILLNGAGYESWLNWVTLPADRLLDTTDAITDRLIPVTGDAIHQHGPTGEHSHEGVAFTVWLDPNLAIRQAQIIQQALSALLPDQAKEFSINLTELTDRLHELDRELEKAFSAYVGQGIIFSHPVYQYLQARYNLNGASLHWEPEEAPGTRDWIDLNELRSRHDASLMLWEDTPLDETIQRLQQSGIRSVSFRIVSGRPAAGDYFSVMKTNLERLNRPASEP